MGSSYMALDSKYRESEMRHSLRKNSLNLPQLQHGGTSTVWHRFLTALSVHSPI